MGLDQLDQGDGLDQRLTQPFADAVAEAEELIASAPFIRSEQDLLEG